MKKRLMFAAVSAAAMLGSPLVSANEELNFDAYREMLADGNPAELYEMEGEELWRTARGPKNATLEQCDVGVAQHRHPVGDGRPVHAGRRWGARHVEDVRRHYEAQIPAGRGCLPSDVVKAIYYIMAQEYETGQAIPVTGGQEMLS